MTEERKTVTLSLVITTCRGTSEHSSVKVVFRGQEDCSHTNDLDPDIDGDKVLGERIDLDQTRIDCAIESSEFGHETNISLVDWLVRVRADDAARDSPKKTDGAPESVDCESISVSAREVEVLVARLTHCAVPAVAISIVCCERLSVLGLQVLTLGRLNVDDTWSL